MPARTGFLDVSEQGVPVKTDGLRSVAFNSHFVPPIFIV